MEGRKGAVPSWDAQSLSQKALLSLKSEGQSKIALLLTLEPTPPVDVRGSSIAPADRTRRGESQLRVLRA
jgi:hypothetical protein